MKIFQSTVRSGVKLRVISKISFAPNCHCADETPTLIFHGPSRKKEGYWILVSRFCIKNVLFCTVTVFSRDNTHTTQKVEACCRQEIIFAVRGAAGQKRVILIVYSAETSWLCSGGGLIWQLWIGTQFKDRLSSPSLDWTVLLCNHCYLLYVLGMLSTICFLPRMPKYIRVLAPVLIFLG